MLISLAVSSLKNRRKSILLTFFSLLISISVLLGVEHIRQQAKESFNRTVSDVDLIVGAPSGQLNLLHYSVFRMGSPTNSINFKSFQFLQNNQQVEWAIPISLGDSHHGFRVIGTNQDYFTHFKYGKKQPLEFEQGQAFSSLFEVVIGIDVAKEHNYQVGDEIVVAHGVGSVSFMHHDDTPFVVSGILKPTGTPVDKSLHVTLQAIEAIHLSPAKLRQLAGEFALFTAQRADRNLLYEKVAARMKNNIASCAEKRCRTHRCTSYKLGNRRVASREVLGQVN
jgi:putative ABC transport system permease protein